MGTPMPGRYFAVAVVSSLLTSGCVSVQQIPLQGTSVEALKGRELMLAKRDIPDFAAMTAGTAGFALIGAAAMITAGNDIVASNNIEDPARHISRRLSDALTHRYSVKLASRETTLASDEVSEIVKNNPDADLVLDTRTIVWSFAYFPTSWARYRVIYTARLRLVDVKGGQVLAEGACAHVPDETPASPSYDELLAQNAARLKKELMAAADFCANEFASKTLSMTLEPAQGKGAGDVERPQAGPVKLEDLKDLLPRK